MLSPLCLHLGVFWVGKGWRGDEEALADGADSNLMAPDELRNLGRSDLGRFGGGGWMVFDVF